MPSANTDISSETPAYPLYIDGDFVTSSDEETFTTIEPATGDTLGTIAQGTRGDVKTALDAAAAIQPELARISPFERAELCHEYADAIDENLDELAELLSRDQGKPRSDATGEVEAGGKLLRMAAEDIKRDETSTHPSTNPAKRFATVREPHGVVGVITPWNYPVAIPLEYIAPGIACGNSVVWVPAPTTSAIAVKLAEVLDTTSIPAGAVNVVPGPGPVVGDEVVSNETTDAVCFTGSPETGRTIAQAARPIPTIMELGGNGPIVVLEDADIDSAASKTAFSCYQNSGQDCAGTERVLVHKAVYEEFLTRLREETAELVVGDPADEESDLGPMNNPQVREKISGHVSDALEKGATMEMGKAPEEWDSDSLFLEPMILTNVTPEMDIFQEETFGPVAPVMTIESKDEAINMANAHGTGLIAGVFTSDLRSAFECIDEIQTGTVHVNEGSCYWEHHTPFGGYSGRDSGHGRLGGRYSIDELSQLKNYSIDIENVPTS